jgi:hypothetical protein
MRQVIGQQGECLIIKIDAIPEGAHSRNIERDAKGRVIISHSENGNHHVLTGGEVMERAEKVPDGMQVFYAILNEPQQFIQDAPVPHEGFDLETGFYEFRVSREFNPFAEEAQRVAD